uniref:Expressed conserved protein n=1 Tax=Echinococcus granulosus TaxID=6210 RepID=A0A068WAB4_ECHGR|nr:hypothetical protein EgrG_000972200 [Echinococcus granulosus]
MFSSYDRRSGRHHQVVLVECNVDEEDGWMRSPRDCPHFPNSWERRTNPENNSPRSFMNRHALEMIRILNCVPPGYSFCRDQHMGFFEVPSRPSMPLRKATQTTDLNRKESSENVRTQRKLDVRRNHTTTNVSYGVKPKQSAPTKQRSQGSSTCKTSKMIPSTCPSFIAVVTQSTINTTRKSSWNRSTKINISTMTHTLPMQSIMKGEPKIEVSLPTRQKKVRITYAINYTYYLNRHYSEVTRVYRNYYSKIEACIPIVQSNCCSFNRVTFIVNYLEGEISLPMYQITTVPVRVVPTQFRPVLSDVQTSKLCRAVKYASPVTKTTPAPSIVHKTPSVPHFSLMYIENVGGYFVKKERPSFKGDNDESASLRQTPITPHISRRYAEYYVSPTPAGESVLRRQQVWASVTKNRASLVSRKLRMTSSEVQTTPDLLDTLTAESRTREDRSKRHTGSIFNRIQWHLHKLGPKSGHYK